MMDADLNSKVKARKQLESIPRAVIANATDYPDGYSTGWHDHSFAQLVYASRGLMEVEAGGKHWIIPPQRALWVPAGMPHRVLMDGMAEMRTLYIRTELFQGLPSDCCVLSISLLMREMILEAVRRPRLYSPGSSDERFIHVMVELIGSLPQESFYLPSPTHPRLKLVTSSLMNNPEDGRTLEDWASFINVSARTLSRLFQGELGMTFVQFRQQARLFKSLKYLTQGQKVSSVAMEVGFSSQSAFIRLFKQTFGRTPSEYSGVEA
jgi:AraC-like DNA-binding protein